ncbi:MAG TPA: TonB-dependent receptor [Verrucomicrobiota bacterium]|nr:hypothetical protein [Verrucomicrobiales bacterium]HRI14029.1 TonB-dependent receptor [Verrucomicrobiota bacterium]
MAQETGSLGGIVINGWDGRPLPGVIVTVRGTILAGTTDASGRYRLEGVPTGEQTVRFSKPGFASTTVSNVRIVPGLPTNLDGSLRPEFFELEEYEVTAEQFQDQALEILEQRQSSTSFLDAISSEQFRRLGATDVAQIITKVPGTTVVEGKYAVIRGLSDRYNLTELNSAVLPTADPYRRAAPLDLIPASMIREVAVSKTFTPNLPGGFAGGLANLTTKSFPDKFVFQVEVGLEYNTQSTGNPDFLTYPGSSTDWAGMDNGYREIPAILENATLADLIPPPPQRRNETPEQAQARLDQANKVQAELGSFNDYTFGPTTKAPPPNYGGNFSYGDTIKINERNFGYFVGGIYKRQWFFYDDGIQARYRPGPGGEAPYQYFRVAQSVMEATWATVVNVAYELVPEDHTIAFTFYWNQNGEDTTRQRNGFVEGVDGIATLNTLQWIQRQVHAYQTQGEDHFEEFYNDRVNWLVSLANTSQDEPDLRYFNYAHEPDDTQNSIGNNSMPEPIRPTRYYRNINEDNIWAQLDNTLTVQQWSGLDTEVKFGGAFNGSTREFQEKTFSFDGESGWRAYGTPNTYFTPENIRYTESPGRFGGTNYNFQRTFFPALGNNTYLGQQQIPAGYAMTQLPVTEQLKIIGGARLENTLLSIDGGGALTRTNSTINQLDVMPSFAAVYDVVTNMDVRFSFSQTVARPTFREIAPYRSYDPYGDEIIEGNPNLKITHINNYDLRWEWYPKPGALLSVSPFYKQLTDPIEKTLLTFGGGIVTFENRPTASLYGVELEASTPLDILGDAFADFDVGFNFAYIHSEVPLTDVEKAADAVLNANSSDSRPLYDQSPWIVNFNFGYDNKRTGTTATVSLSTAGPYVYLVDLGGPDVYEHPPLALTFFASQRLAEHVKLRLTVKNILNSENLRTYGESADGPIYSRATGGVSIRLTIAFDY